MDQTPGFTANSSPVDKLAEALSKAQAEITAPKKNRMVDFTGPKGRVKYAYADLADVIEAIKGPLGKNGLSITHALGYEAGMYGLKTALMHSSGQFVVAWYPLPDPGKQQIRAQEFGSAITYARRYSLSALVGIASEEDDDGEKAAPTEPPPRRDHRPPPRRDARPPMPPPPKAQGPAKDTTPASDELLAMISAECGARQIGSNMIAYLIRKGFGMDPEQNIPTWIAQDILKTISNEDCTEATVLARAELLKNARVARGMADQSSEPEPAPQSEQAAFNKEMETPVADDKDPAYAGDQVSKDPIDRSFEDYIIPYGKWKGKYLADIGVLEARKYLDFLVDAAKKEEKTLSGWQQEFQFYYEHFAASLAKGGVK